MGARPAGAIQRVLSSTSASYIANCKSFPKLNVSLARLLLPSEETLPKVTDGIVASVCGLLVEDWGWEVPKPRPLGFNHSETPRRAWGIDMLEIVAFNPDGGL